jgi:hypothetical protein
MDAYVFEHLGQDDAALIFDEVRRVHAPAGVTV